MLQCFNSLHLLGSDNVCNEEMALALVHTQFKCYSPSIPTHLDVDRRVDFIFHDKVDSTRMIFSSDILFNGVQL